MPTLQNAFTDRAPAKVNLTLRILGKRADGYHDLESLVVFARLADEVRLTLDVPLGLNVDGPTAAAAGELADNLVLRAARELASRIDGLRLGRFALTKHLPVAAGLGGGSADAAAALRLIMRVNGIAHDSPHLMAAARATGADVPVCLDPRPRVMRGIGELLSAPLDLPALPAVLVNPRVPVPTKDVFARLGLAPGERRGEASEVDAASLEDRDALIHCLATQPNDLEPPARALQPVISEVLTALSGCDGCLFARMSGSGATCFGLFGTNAAAAAAAQRISGTQPGWWIAPTVFGN